jgi:hypothetical protein
MSTNALPAPVVGLPTARVVKRIHEPRWVGIVELKAGMCRFLREVESGVEYCGAPTTPWISSWCQAHREVVYPAQERPRRTGGAR